ncbi:MAG TPA: nucleotide exchange factor GrpE [Solirubrobacteraceae bacterium]|nr:nucleotide exchange factor GrpE [Solirubrobacteraceae bacterium]
MGPSTTPPHGDPVTEPDPRPEAQEEQQPEAQEDQRPAAAQEQRPQPVPAGEPEAPVGPAPSMPPEDDDPAGEDEPLEPDDDDLDGAEEARVAHDLEKLTAKAQKADEYLELAQRTKADFENYRKRAAREAGAAQERGVVRLAKELLPAVDNLDRALEAVDSASNGADLVAGIKLVHAEVLAALARVGVEPFDPAGQAFDPSWHEAVAQQPVDGAQSGTVAEVYQRGYRLGDTVIRPARVLVAG